jgi:hypothetical protein
MFRVSVKTPTLTSPSASPSIAVEGGLARKGCAHDARNSAVGPWKAHQPNPTGKEKRREPVRAMQWGAFSLVRFFVA